MPLCMGTLLVASDQDAFVLTAAHCLERLPRHRLLVSAIGDASRFLAVTDVYLHPRYAAAFPPAPYDAAILRVQLPLRDFCRVSRVDVDFGAIPAGGNVTLTWFDPSKNACQPTAVPILDATTQAFWVPAPPGRDCRGQSGGPAYVQVAGQPKELVGIVSHGRMDCSERVALIGVSSIREGFLDAVRDRKQPRLAPESCGRCVDAVALDPLACAPAFRRCMSEDPCRRFLGCLRQCSSADCATRCIAASPFTARRRSVVRCFCTRRCKAACADVCSSPESGFTEAW